MSRTLSKCVFSFAVCLFVNQNFLTKWNDWSFTWFSKTPFVWSFPIRQEICDVSQIGFTFHRICPPFFIQTSIARTAPSAIPCVSDLCGVDVQGFQERSSQALPNSKEIVSVNDLKASYSAPRTFASSFFLCFLRSFCFARIRLDPLSGQVLHHDCISMIVSRITFFNENFVIRCDQVTKIFCTKYDCTSTSSARSSLLFFVFKQISQFGSFGKCVNTLFLPEPGSTFGRGTIGRS